MSSGLQLSTGIKRKYCIFRYAERMAREESDDEWEYDGATNIFKILDDEINNKELKCTHCFLVNNSNELC